MKWKRWAGFSACLLVIISCFLHWTWYPDIQEYFSGFYSKNNYYGRPGVLLSFFTGCGLVFYPIKKVWSDRLNMIFSAICAAYAVTAFLRFTSGYDGFVPEKQAGVYLMLIGALGHLLMSVLIASMVKKQVPVSNDEAPSAGEPTA